ncbi:MAG: hypothetical protein EP298_03300 [Gammaproteobacteria bacterium]|nr:MAG: hypothetical protein EP298_03300 [Gammaproteobacteria bacterium]UTW43547.1 hypothetical protein KFE69_05510 [bacterium SCSIO 12844]
MGRDIKYTITTTVDGQKLKANNDFSVKSPTLDISLPAFTQMLQATCHSDDIKCKKAVKEAYAEAPLAFKQMLQATIFSVCGTPAGDNKPWCKGFLNDKSNKTLTEISPDFGKHDFMQLRKWCDSNKATCKKADDIIMRIGPVFIMHGLMEWRKHHHGDSQAANSVNDNSAKYKVAKWCDNHSETCKKAYEASMIIGVYNTIFSLMATCKYYPDGQKACMKQIANELLNDRSIDKDKLADFMTYHRNHDEQVINSMNYYTKANI